MSRTAGLLRVVYSSPRIDNVDRVAEMLGAEGIETRIQNRDKLNRGRFQRFSYKDTSSASEWPMLQVVSAEDMPKARELLRAAGLMGSTRPGAAEPSMPRWQAPNEGPDPTAMRMRRVAMVGVLAALIALAWAYSNAKQTVPPTPAPAPAAAPAPVEDNTVFLIDESEPEPESEERP
jgi:hypothetical protein